jgi:NADPH-ferrihemoprotein reductase
MDFSSQLFILFAVLLSTVLSWRRDWRLVSRRGQDKRDLNAFAEKEASGSRDLVKRMEELGTRCVVFYGSETGTAEEYAKRLAQEGKSQYGLETLLADPSEFDFNNLDQVPSHKAVILVLASAGEGDPTENAAEFFKFIAAKGTVFSQNRNPPLGNLHFAAFGLGNTTYEHYNAVIRKTTVALSDLGAVRVGITGEGDDGAGTVEEDFMEWKESMWSALSLEMGLEKHDAANDQSSSTFTTRHDLNKQSPEVFLGELSTGHLRGDFSGPPSKINPHLAPVRRARELFSTLERNCIHMEIDVSGYSGRGQSYQTGDHVAIWPTNSTQDVDAFLGILDLLGRRDEVISFSGVDGSIQVPFLTPTTYDAITRYYIEIAGPVPRDHVARIASFAPTDKARQFMAKLGSDRDLFANQVTKRCLSLAMVLHEASEGEPWTGMPFAIIIEGIRLFDILLVTRTTRNPVYDSRGRVS